MENYKGLSMEEVKHSRAEHGSNAITAKKCTPFWQRYLQSFNDPIIVVLMVALAINVLFTFFGKVEWYECAGILLSMLLATLVSTFSEYRNESTFQKLQSEASQILCKVYRGGNLEEVFIQELVAGDLVLLQSGDLIPADGSIIGGNIKVDQSALNGESKEQEKTARKDGKPAKIKLADFWNKHQVFRGSVVCSGEAVMCIEAVGDATVYGRLTHETQTEGRQSPLTLKLTKLAKSISRFGYLGAVAVVLICLFQNSVMANHFQAAEIAAYFADTGKVLSDLIETLILGIIVIVVAVPEGLPLMIAIVCSLNMKKMLKSNVLVRKLIGIETAGSINILFSDKTGTITKGQLEVVEFIQGDNKKVLSYRSIPHNLRQLLDISAICNSAARLSGKKIIGGNATEKAILKYVSGGMEKRMSHIHILNEIPFSSDKKFSAVQVSGEFSGCLIKGAPELILKRCDSYYDENGNVTPLRSITELDRTVNTLANRAIRVLAFAVAEQQPEGGRLPERMTLVGLIGVRDEVRREARDAIAEVKQAGIQVVMITGDKKETAVAIAKDAGLLSGGDEIVLTSAQLAEMSDDEIKECLPSVRVIARALPTDKSRLVRLAQEMELVVGMTGDGVNDSPALKRADVGFAMGSGTEVAKEAGDIVIMDDNFLSIKNAVLYGRTIYNSIKKFITFQLTINVAAVTVSLLGPIMGIEKPLDITQMLWINLVMDTLAAIAFGGEPALRRYLQEKPKRRDEDIIDKKMWSAIIVDGLYICVLSMAFFALPQISAAFRTGEGQIYFYTGYFAFFIFTCIFNAFNARADGMDLLENISINKQFLWIIGMICAVQVIMTYLGGMMLRTAGLNLKEWFVVLMLAITIIPVDLLRKFFVRAG